DQFYWSIDDTTLIGYQMPVSIVGLRPERYLSEPNSYWDFGLIWEYCPKSEVCVIGDSDEFLMMELREKSVAEDQVVPGPPNKQEIAERMVTWVTPYQQHFLNFPLTLHDHDLPATVKDARLNLRSFVDEVMSKVPPLPSHIKHSQWEYHWADFQDVRRLSSRIRSWSKTRLQHALEKTSGSAQKTFGAAQKTLGAAQKTLGAAENAVEKRFGTVRQNVKRKAVEICKPYARVVGNRYVRPALHRLGLEVV